MVNVSRNEGFQIPGSPASYGDNATNAGTNETVNLPNPPPAMMLLWIANVAEQVAASTLLGHNRRLLGLVTGYC